MNQQNTERLILVTGATGKQGGAVAHHLLQHGFRVRALMGVGINCTFRIASVRIGDDLALLKLTQGVLQQNIKRLDAAYKNFFEGQGFPKFKNRSNFTSFTFTVGVKILDDKIYLPKLGWMRFHNSISIPNGFTSVAKLWRVSIRDSTHENRNHR